MVFSIEELFAIVVMTFVLGFIFMDVFRRPSSPEEMISAYGKGPLPLPPHGDPQRSHHVVVVHERVHKAVPKAAGDDRHEPVRKKRKSVMIWS